MLYPAAAEGIVGLRGLEEHDSHRWVPSRTRGPDLLLHVDTGANASFHRCAWDPLYASRHASVGADSPGVLLPVVAKAELHADLVMADRSVDDMAPNLCHFKPFEIPERFSRRLNPMLDGIFDAGLRCSDDLGNAVNMIAHLWSPFEVPLR
jgi:hypothetical protein